MIGFSKVGRMVRSLIPIFPTSQSNAIRQFLHSKLISILSFSNTTCDSLPYWLDSVAAQEVFRHLFGSSIQVIVKRVDDGVIVFPYTSMGREAQAEGVFEAIKLSPEQIEAREQAAHNHQEGETCDKDGPKSEGAGAGCDAPVVDVYVYMIRGTGAVIKG